MGVRALADAEQCHRGRFARHQEDRGTFADIDAVAIAAERVAPIGRDQFQRLEPVHRQAAERVRAADDGRVAEAETNEPGRRGEDFAAGGARGRKRIGGPGQAEMIGDERSEIAQLLLGIAVRGRPRPGTPALGQSRLAFGHARRAGAHDDGDALGAATAHDLVDLGPDLLQRGQGEAVVPAVESVEAPRDLRQRRRHRADAHRAPRDQVVAPGETVAIAGEEVARDLLLADAERIGEPQRIQVEPHSAATVDRRSRA